MTEPKSNIRYFAEAVAREKRQPVPKLVALPDDAEGSAFDAACREVLERFERAHEAMKAEESDR